jgi:hypothetical protein
MTTLGPYLQRCCAEYIEEAQRKAMIAFRYEMEAIALQAIADKWKAEAIKARDMAAYLLDQKPES